MRINACVNPACRQAVATKADNLMDQFLAETLHKGVLSTEGCTGRPVYELPTPPLSAQRMALLRGGFERLESAESQSFQRQNALQALLLAGLANVLRGHALSLRGLNRYVEAASAWQRILDTLDQVLPASELSASVANDMLSNKLLAFHLDYQRAANKDTLGGVLGFRAAKAALRCWKSNGYRWLLWFLQFL
eukprot:g29422.t1